MSICVHVVPAEGPSFERTLDGDSFVLGRASGCELVLADPFLSRNHARLFRQGDEWLAEDLGSRNGTRVDGMRIEGPTAVGKGSVIELSGSVVTLIEGPMPLLSRMAPSTSGATIFRRVSDLVERPASSLSTVPGSTELERYAARLELLNEVHAALGSSLTLDQLLELILDRAFAHLRPEAGVIFLRDGDQLRVASRRSSTPGEHAPLVSETLALEVVEKGMAALVLDATTDSRFAAAESILASGVRSLIAAPLLEPEGCHGMIVLSSRVHVRQFNEEDLGVLASLASVAGLRIRHVALAQEAAERRRLEGELALARRIQEALLPHTVPELDGWELAALNTPSRGVSGDLYKFQQGTNEGNTLQVLLADVSGKGMSAALLTATLEALVTGPLEVGLPPVEIVSRLSRRLYERTPPERYATLFLTAVDLTSGEIRFVNAGHNAGLLVRQGGEVEQLGSTGTPIGLLPGATYSEGSRRMAAGDLLVLYTDGITEAVDELDEEYGLERLTEVVRDNAAQSLDELMHTVGLGLDAFTDDVPYHDDRTMILLRRRP